MSFVKDAVSVHLYEAVLKGRTLFGLQELYMLTRSCLLAVFELYWTTIGTCAMLQWSMCRVLVKNVEDVL